MLFYDPPKKDNQTGQEAPQFYNSHANKSANEELKVPEPIPVEENKKESVAEVEQSKEPESNPSEANEEYEERYYEERHDYYPRQRYNRRGNRRGRNPRPHYDRSSYIPRYSNRGQVY